MVHGDMVYLYGQLGFEPGSSTPELVSVNNRYAILANLSAILYEAESKIDHVILTAVYISDVAAWPVVSAI